MGRQSKRKSVLESIEERKKRLGFDKGIPPGFVTCKRPGCEKLVPEKQTRKGYCQSCINKAYALKRRRETEQLQQAVAVELGLDEKEGMFG